MPGLGESQRFLWYFGQEMDKGPWYSATPSRGFKQGDQWKESDSLGEDDLLRMCKLLDQADTWIKEQHQAGRQAA